MSNVLWEDNLDFDSAKEKKIINKHEILENIRASSPRSIWLNIPMVFFGMIGLVILYLAVIFSIDLFKSYFTSGVVGATTEVLALIFVVFWWYVVLQYFRQIFPHLKILFERDFPTKVFKILIMRGEVVEGIVSSVETLDKSQKKINYQFTPSRNLDVSASYITSSPADVVEGQSVRVIYALLDPKYYVSALL